MFLLIQCLSNYINDIFLIKTRKYDYQDQYCISYENYEEKSIDKKYTKKERLDCEKAVVEVGDEL